MLPSIPEIPVIYFHSIVPEKDPNWNRNYLSLELKYFESFLRYLKKNKWETVFLNEYFCLNHSVKKQKNICCITFDDGFLDNFIYALPLLKQFGFKGTIFVSPEFIDLKRSVSKTLEDVWENKFDMNDIKQSGYLSWDELRKMQGSGFIDIQSHSMTHTKYFVSDEIVSFHHPGGDCLYPIGNLYPEQKPYYNNNEFERLIPYGTPFYKAFSAIIARKVYINRDFNNLIIDMLTKFNWQQKQAHKKALEKVYREYLFWKNNNKIIKYIETKEDFDKRLYYEIVRSKEIIEHELNKKVEFLCWPFGENNETVHQFALSAGYLATTTGSKRNINRSTSRIPVRMNLGVVYDSVFLTDIKNHYKMFVYKGNPSMKLIQKILNQQLS